MPRLILLSGWGMDARIWQPLASFWPGDINVTAPDWPGYGTRRSLAAPSDSSTLATAMASELHADAVWVGWSLGGLLAANLLAHLPPPRTLVMLGMASRLCMPQPGAVTPAQLTAFRRAFARDPDTTWQRFLHWQASGEPSFRNVSHRLRVLLGPVPPANRATLAAGLAQLAELDVDPLLRAASCPVIHLRGEHDPLMSPAALPDIDTLADCGHCPQLSQPSLLAQRLVRIARQSALPAQAS